MFILIIIIIILFFVFYFKTKKLKIPNVFLVTGAVKTGKSFLSLNLAIKLYKKSLLKWRIKKVFKKDLEKPMLFSNIPLRYVKFNLITLDVIKRYKRIPYGSVCFIDEASLLADSMSYKNDLLNEEINLFLKLFGHSTKGGYLILNTQSISDLHYGIKRCVNSYLWIHSKIKFPFITVLKVRELIYSDDSTTAVNVSTSDVDSDLKTLFVLNKYYKYYDCFCYSVLTDNLPVEVDYSVNKLSIGDSLKTNKIISFRDFKSAIMKGVKNEKS